MEMQWPISSFQKLWIANRSGMVLNRFSTACTLCFLQMDTASGVPCVLYDDGVVSGDGPSGGTEGSSVSGGAAIAAAAAAGRAPSSVTRDQGHEVSKPTQRAIICDQRPYESDGTLYEATFDS